MLLKVSILCEKFFIKSIHPINMQKYLEIWKSRKTEFDPCLTFSASSVFIQTELELIWLYNGYHFDTGGKYIYRSLRRSFCLLFIPNLGLFFCLWGKDVEISSKILWLLVLDFLDITLTLLHPSEEILSPGYNLLWFESISLTPCVTSTSYYEKGFLIQIFHLSILR